MKPHAYLFVDGSSSKNEDIGAWTAVAVSTHDHAQQLLWGVTFPATISRCELMPIVEGLRWIKANWAKGQGYVVEVYSDSEYTVRTLSGEYLRRKNHELWTAVDDAADGMVVRFIWRERNSTEGGTLCDNICGRLRRMLIDKWKEIADDPRKPLADCPPIALPRTGEQPDDSGTLS